MTSVATTTPASANRASFRPVIVHTAPTRTPPLDRPEMPIRFGSRSLPRPDLEASAAVWTSSGFPVELYEDTDQMVWEKFIVNVAFSGTSCATGLSIGQIMADPSAWAVAKACARESRNCHETPP